MIKIKPWHKIPSVPLMEALPTFRWAHDGFNSPSSQTAALMLYVALNFIAESSVDERGQYVSISAASYVDLARATGLSRSLICSGLEVLRQNDLITSEGSHQKRRYKITWPAEHRFFKLPCQPIVTRDVIKPFLSFTMRSKHELHALKLYLYLAAVRDNYQFYSQATYETIYARMEISERHIRKAISVLINSGLMQSVDNTYSGSSGKNEANKYYFTGYRDLVMRQGSGWSETAAETMMRNAADFRS